MGMRKPKESKAEQAAKKDEKKKDEKKFVKRKLIEGVRGLVRVAEVDLAGEKKIPNALLKIKGVGQSLANAIPQAAGLDSNLMIGTLTDEQVARLEEVIKNPIKHGIPFHMVNRRRDPQSGENRHVVSSELALTLKSDVDLMKKTRSYKGIRHELGQPVRGQRTRSSFRTGAMVGVAKGAARAAMKAVPAAAAGAPAGAPIAGAPAAKPAGPATKTPAPAKTEKKEEKK
jgi:small subunit ribosomal protein S13